MFDSRSKGLTQVTANPADALTKDISPKTLFREYMARIYQKPDFA